MTTTIPQSVLLDLLVQQDIRTLGFNPSGRFAVIDIAKAINRAGTPCKVVGRVAVLRRGNDADPSSEQHVFGLCMTENLDDVFNVAGMTGWHDILAGYIASVTHPGYDNFEWITEPEIKGPADPIDHQDLAPLIEAIACLGQKYALGEAVEDSAISKPANVRKSL